jgi:hypothetical protein
MGAIDKFSETLTSTGRDDLVTVLQAMSDGQYKRRITEIESDLAKIVSEINETNSRREQLSGQRALLERLLKKMDEHEKSHVADLEMQLFKLHLSNQLDKLKVRIAETRPDDELKRKHDLTQERALLDAGRRIAISLMGRIARNQESGNASTS